MQAGTDGSWSPRASGRSPLLCSVGYILATQNLKVSAQHNFSILHLDKQDPFSWFKDTFYSGKSTQGVCRVSEGYG